MNRVSVYQDWSVVESTHVKNGANTPTMLSDNRVSMSIQRQRISRMWTISSLSKRTDIPAEDLVAYENGRLIPGPSVIALLQHVFMADLK